MTDKTLDIPETFGPQIDAVRDYWNSHLHDQAVVKAEPGTLEFFDQLDTYRFGKLHYLPKLVKYDSYAGKKILDVGCGAAIDGARFAAGGAELTGIDVADVSLKLAQKNFELRSLPGEFRIMDAEKLEFPDNHFDVAYCHTVLMYTADMQKMIDEMHRVLKPGGVAILHLFNRRSWLTAMSKIVKVDVEHIAAPNFGLYSSQEFEAKLTRFSNIDMIFERFPYPTKIHSGLKAQLYNNVFVRGFNLIPQAIVRPLGWHLVAFATK